jgi:hypothetical protein
VHTRQRCREIFVAITMLVTVLLVLALTGCAGLSRGAAGDPPPGAPVSGAFGFDIHNALTSWPQEPFAWWRLWDAGVDWSRVEPSANQFDFSLMDQYVALAREHNVKIIYVLGNTPPWASTDPSRTGTQGVPGGTSPPKDMQQWQNFVTAVVTRYKGKIAAYEVWNEADLPGYWTGTMQQMVQMCQIAHDTIKKIDSSATVLSPSVVAGDGLTWLPQFFAAGGASTGDVVAYHMYDPEPVPENSLPFLRQMIQAAAAGGKQIWDDEDGWGPWGQFPNDQAAAAYVARSLILKRSLGIPVIVWFAWDDRGPWVNLFMVGPDLQTPTTAATAFATVTSWLDGSGVTCGNTGDTWQCTLTGSTRHIVWSTSGSGSFTIPPQWGAKTVVDLAGNSQSISGSTVSLSTSPVLLK